MEKPEFSYIIGKKVNWYIHCGERSVPQKAKHTVTIRPSYSTSRYIPKITEYKDTKTCMPMIVKTLFTIAKS